MQCVWLSLIFLVFVISGLVSWMQYSHYCMEATGSSKSLSYLLLYIVQKQLLSLVGLMDKQVHVCLLKYIFWYTKPIIYTLYYQVCKLHTLRTRLIASTK